MNHFAVRCMNNKKIRILGVEYTIVENSEDEYFGVNSLNSVYSVVRNSEENKKWTQIIKINNLNVKVRLNTGAVKRRVPIVIETRLKETLDHLEKIKVIESVSEPVDWLSNTIVEVEKSNKNLRICLDALNLNKALKHVKYLIPTIKEIIPKLKGKNILL